MHYKRILVLGLMAICAFKLLGIADVSAQAKPIKIGFIAPFTGQFAGMGGDMRDTWLLYLDKIGHKVSGRNIELILEDTQMKPDVGLTKVRKLIEKDKVDILAGVFSSGVAYAIRDYVHRSKVPLMICNAGADDLTKEKRSPYIFRSSFANTQDNPWLGEYLYHNLGLRKLVLMGQDYAAGWEWCGSLAFGFINSGGQVVQEFYTALGTSDFAPYLTAFNRDADVVYGFYSGSEAVRFQTQFSEYGLKGKVTYTGGINSFDNYVLSQVGDRALGAIGQGVKGDSNHPDYKAYAKSFKEKFGHEPNTFGDASYLGAQLTMEALRKVNGNIEDKEGFLTALRGIKLPDTGWGVLSFDEYQNVVHDVRILKAVRDGQGYKIDIIHTYPQKNQFWRYTPEEWFKKVPNMMKMKGTWSEYRPQK
ncbi:MAG: ABC transporter substrate-binding protein [Deltaproteobacteria bacterium HGW-Deltaproteobacteria-21]|nr:MAG: ABC transporter substrate-binding protein [Deltaproteobacteria bacterium HGW-Deltaproteobacteria-21]